MSSNQINTDNSKNSNLIQISNNNVKYYENLAEKYAKNAEKSVSDCASYLSAAQRCITECNKVKEGLVSEVNDSINPHIENDENPHNVTAEQTGAYSKSETDTLIAGLTEDIENVETTAAAALTHSQLTTGNPHNVTAEQTGAYTKSEVDNLLGNVSVDMSNYYTKTEIDTNLSAKVDNSDLSAVATSGSYSDLTDKPSIPTVSSTYSATSKNAMNGVAIASAISEKADTSLFTKNGLYITTTNSTTEWSRAYYSDSAKSTLVWLEQGGYIKCTTSVKSGSSTAVSITLPTAYNNGYYARSAFTVQPGFSCTFAEPSSSAGGSALSVTVYNNTSSAQAPTGIWWQTAGIPSELDSGGTAGDGMDPGFEE